MRNCADVAVAIVNEPNEVTPVFTAIVIVPDAVFITVKSYPTSVVVQAISVSSVVPKGIVTVYVVPVVLMICDWMLAFVSVAAALIPAGAG